MVKNLIAAIEAVKEQKISNGIEIVRNKMEKEGDFSKYAFAAYGKVKPSKVDPLECINTLEEKTSVAVPTYKFALDRNGDVIADVALSRISVVGMFSKEEIAEIPVKTGRLFIGIPEQNANKATWTAESVQVIETLPGVFNIDLGSIIQLNGGIEAEKALTAIQKNKEFTPDVGCKFLNTSASGARQAKSTLAWMPHADTYLERAYEIVGGIDAQGKDLTPGKAQKLATRAGHSQVDGKRIAVDLKKYCFVVRKAFDDLDSFDGQIWHNHDWLCREYGLPSSEVSTYHQGRLMNCSKDGSYPVSEADITEEKEFIRVIENCGYSNEPKDIDFSGDKTAWIIGNPEGPCISILDCNAWKISPEIELSEDAKVLIVMKFNHETKARIGAQGGQYACLDEVKRNVQLI